MGSDTQPLATSIAIFLLTFFLDLLELSYARIVWFMRTLRFWLYFILHFGLSCLAAYLLHAKITSWYLLAPLATFLGVAVISNVDVKVAGLSLVPIAQFFVSIKSKMFEQAAEEKANQVIRAQLIERLVRLPLRKIEPAHTAALLATGVSPENLAKKVARAHKLAKGDQERYKAILISQLVKANPGYAQENLAHWEQAP